MDDIFAEYERMKALGVRFRSEPVAIEAGRNKGGYTCYFLDPDDITLEIIQPPARVVRSVDWRGASSRLGGQRARHAPYLRKAIYCGRRLKRA